MEKLVNQIEEAYNLCLEMPGKKLAFHDVLLPKIEEYAQSARDEERERIAADFKFHSAFNPSCSCAFIVESLTRND